jgi:hypothetical protein
MTRTTTPRARPHCPDNDCQRQQAEALSRIAEVGEKTLQELQELKPHLEAFGDVAARWLRFCAFIRKWFPKLWWLALPAATFLTKGSSEAADALLSALTLFLQAHTGGGT